MKKIIYVLIAALVLIFATTAIAESEAHTHTWGEWKVVNAATCGEEGKQRRNCTECGEIENKSISATGDHSWGEWKTVNAATCGEEGKQRRNCTVCGDIENKSISATGDHSWGEWKTVNAATCGEEGKQRRTCTVCGDIENKAISATGDHSWGSWKTVTAATCTKEGLQRRSCTACPELNEEAIAKLPHTEETVPAKAADCTATGLTEGKKCSVCGTVTVAQQTVAALGHDNETIDAVAPTCTETGLTAGTKCKRCGIATVRDIVPALGHDYESKKVSATTTSRGYTKHTCTVCGDTYKDNYTAKKTVKVAVTAAPTATPAPAGVYGSIVTDVNFEDELYEVEIGTQAVEGAVVENNLLTIVAAADENGAYTLRNLHLSLELVAELKTEGIEYICFVVGEYELVFPIVMFEAEEIALIAGDLAAELTGYVVTVDPAAVNAEGVAGCTVKAALATEDGEMTAVNSFLTGMVLCKADQQVEVAEADFYTMIAA